MVRGDEGKKEQRFCRAVVEEQWLQSREKTDAEEDCGRGSTVTGSPLRADTSQCKLIPPSASHLAQVNGKGLLCERRFQPTQTHRACPGKCKSFLSMSAQKHQTSAWPYLNTY